MTVLRVALVGIVLAGCRPLRTIDTAADGGSGGTALAPTDTAADTGQDTGSPAR